MTEYREDDMDNTEGFIDQVTELCRAAAASVDMTETSAFDSIVVRLGEAGINIDADGTRDARATSPNTLAVIEDPDEGLDFIQWDGGADFTVYGYEKGALLAELCSEAAALEDFFMDPPLSLEDLEPLRFVLQDGVKHYDVDDVYLVHEKKVEARKKKREETRAVSLSLPDEFMDLCDECKVDPTAVLRGFIADLCHLETRPYITSGSDERDMAEQYFERCGYRFR